MKYEQCIKIGHCDQQLFPDKGDVRSAVEFS
jgi:hypothetical protein